MSFDVVIPSLPGYGFSSQPRAPGMNLSRIAPLWAGLMTRLGHERFLVSGSDMGAGVERALVREAPHRIIGAHCVNAYSGFPRPAGPTPEEQAWFGRTDGWTYAEGAYAMIQGAGPAALAVGLNDSPAGLAAWILEKFQAWSDCDGGPLNAFDLDELCSILSVCWFTGTTGSSVRLHEEAFADAEPAAPAAPHEVPHAVLPLPADHPAPRTWGERHPRNLVRWTELDQRGHFPALEVPEAMARDLRAFHGQIA